MNKRVLTVCMVVVLCSVYLVACKPNSENTKINHIDEGTQVIEVTSPEVEKEVLPQEKNKSREDISVSIPSNIQELLNNNGGFEALRAQEYQNLVDPVEDYLVLTNIYGFQDSYILDKKGTQLITTNASGSKSIYLAKDAEKYFGESAVFYGTDGAIILHDSKQNSLHLISKDNTVYTLLKDMYFIQECIYEEGYFYVLVSGPDIKKVLIKVKGETGEVIELCTEDITDFTLYEGDVYYFTVEEDGSHMIKSHDNGMEDLFTLKGYINDFSIHNDFIYYSAEGRDLIKLNLSGLELDRLQLGYFHNFVTDGQFIYFRNLDVFKVDMNFEHREVIYIMPSEQQGFLAEKQLYALAEDQKLYLPESNILDFQKDGYIDLSLESFLPNSLKNVQVVDDWIYYINLDDDKCLYRSDASGKSTERIFNASVLEYVVRGNEIYYIDEGLWSELWLYSMKTKKKQLITRGIAHISLEEDTLYYANIFDGNKFYSLDLGTKKKTKVLEGVVKDYVLLNNQLFYTNLLEQNKLYLYDRKTGINKKVSDDPVTAMAIEGEQLYAVLNVGVEALYIWNNATGHMDFHSFVNRAETLTTHMIVKDEVAYFLSANMGCFYWVRTSVKQKVQYNERYVYNDEDLHYEQTFTHMGYLYRVNNETREVHKIVDEPMDSYILDDDWLYYGNCYTNGYLSCFNLKTGEKQEIAGSVDDYDSEWYEFSVQDGLLYYGNTKDTTHYFEYNPVNGQSNKIEGSYTPR